MKKPIIRKTVFLLFIAFSLAMAACKSATLPSLQPGEIHPPAVASGPRKTVYFPRQRKTDGEWAAMDALTRGILVLANNCIRLERDHSLANHLLIYSPDFNLSIENDATIILYGENSIVASIGDRVQISGGEIPLLSV